MQPKPLSYNAIFVLLERTSSPLLGYRCGGQGDPTRRTSLPLPPPALIIIAGRSGTKVIKNAASPSVDATVLLAFCHCEDAAHQALHPMK